MMIVLHLQKNIAKEKLYLENRFAAASATKNKMAASSENKMAASSENKMSVSSEKIKEAR